LIILVNIWIVAPFFHDHALGRPQINPRAALRSRSGGRRCCACRDRLAFVIEEMAYVTISGNGDHVSHHSAASRTTSAAASQSLSRLDRGRDEGVSSDARR
jgi:hypothetical protein